MSTLKVNRAQLGQSNTATQNFTLDASASDGTMKLARGNAGASTQDILTVDSSGNLGSIDNSGLNRMVLRTAAATTSGTAIDFTGIPSWAKRITIQVVGVSCSGAGYVGVRLGTGATPTYAASGYLGCAWQGPNFVNFTDLIAGSSHNSASDVRHGAIVLTRQTGNTWAATSVVATSNAASVGGGAFSTTLGGELTAVRFTTHSGDTFDAGSVNILIEG